MRSSVLVLGVVVTLIGGATWYGLNRKETGGPSNPDVRQKVMLADKFVEQGEGDKALEVLDKLVEDGFKIGQKGELLRLKALTLAGRHGDAAQAAGKFADRYPQSGSKADAEVIRLTAELGSSGMSNPKLRQEIDAFLSRNPEHPGAMKLHAALARQDLNRGDTSSAQRRLERALGNADRDAETFEVARLLGDANLRALHSTALGEGDHVYEVKKGDYLAKIAGKYGITVELLMTCNGIDDPKKLRIGQKLKVPNVDFTLECDIARNTLTLRNHGQFFKLYRVRTGREAGGTPAGTYKVLNKKRNPTWRPGNGYEYGPGDPNNELGTRWMAFEGDILGIHGTIHPETVGEYASNGCVGMVESDVQELFDIITVGTPLTIVGEQDLSRHRVIPAPNVPAPRQMASGR